MILICSLSTRVLPLMVFLTLLMAPALASAVGVELRVPDTDSARLSFSPGGEHQVVLRVETDGVMASVDDGESRILLEEPVSFQEEIRVNVADYNFDGLLDVGILESEGYGGVNLFTAVFVFDAGSATFESWFTESNIWLDTHAEEIHTSQRSGPRHFVTVYRIHEGEPYAYQQSVLVGMDLEKVTITDPDNQLIETRIVDLQDESFPALRTISTERAYFHTAPGEDARTEVYIVQGDQVELLDSAGDWDDWFLVRYSGNKVFERWIQAEAIGDAVD